MKSKKSFFKYNSSKATQYLEQTKNTFFLVSNTVSGKFQNLKDYIKSDNFEEDIDLLIVNLQWLDHLLDVPNLERFKRTQRINKKIQLIRNSFVRLNAQGFLLGGLVAGPHGATAGTGFVTGSFAFLIARILFDRATSQEGEVILV